MSVLVYVEHAEGKFKKSAFEVVSYAKAVANQLNTNLTAVSIGDVKHDELLNLGRYGASKIFTINHDKLKHFVNQAYAGIVTEVAEKESSSVIILSNSFSGKGLAPRLAVKLSAGLVTGAIDLPEVNDGNFVVKRTAFSGKAIAFVELLSKTKIITLNPNAYQIVETDTSATIEVCEPGLRDTDFGTIVKEIIKSANKVSLPEAEIVVSGGRGLKGPENWAIIEDLANALGAATACSKPVSDAGWRPHEEHVGQTGISVSPNLYIAIGISGAIQHLAGISSSKTIVVINKDPGAPFFKVADYGIVGDALEIVPKLTAAIKAYKSNI